MLFTATSVIWAKQEGIQVSGRGCIPGSVTGQ